jgi:hypothetical protein
MIDLVRGEFRQTDEVWFTFDFRVVLSLGRFTPVQRLAYLLSLAPLN